MELALTVLIWLVVVILSVVFVTAIWFVFVNYADYKKASQEHEANMQRVREELNR